MVFAQHYLSIPWGWAGVDLFFVISGFLITGILFDTRSDQHRVRNFYVRRTLRIFPLYYGIMLTIVVSWPLMHWQIDGHWLVWILYLGNFARFVSPYAQDDSLQRLADFQPVAVVASKHIPLFLGHFWSLCVEEQFYFVWPWIVFWIRDRRRLAVVCAITVPLCLAMRITGQHILPPWMLDKEILYRETPFRLDALLIGGLIALILSGARKDALLRAARILLPIGCMIVLIWALAIRSVWRRPYIYPDWKFTWGLTAADVLSALLILAALQTGSITNRIFQIRPLRWLGRISYGAYVFHDIPHPLYAFVADKLVRRLEAGWRLSEKSQQLHVTLLTAGIALACTLFLSWISFRFFESFFLNLKERWTIRSARRADAIGVSG